MFILAKLKFNKENVILGMQVYFVRIAQKDMEKYLKLDVLLANMQTILSFFCQKFFLH